MSVISWKQFGILRRGESFIQLHGSDIEDFHENHSLQYGCAFLISKIGEHNKRLSSDFTSRYCEADWKGAAKMRDIIVHKYGSVNLEVLRDTAIKDIPLLKEEYRRIIYVFGRRMISKLQRTRISHV